MLFVQEFLLILPQSLDNPANSKHAYLLTFRLVHLVRLRPSIHLAICKTEPLLPHALKSEGQIYDALNIDKARFANPNG